MSFQGANSLSDKIIIVTGGAGYIGSHTVLSLMETGHKVLVVDNLSTGRRKAVPNDITFIEGDVEDSKLINDIMQSYDVGTVIHFAGSIVVPESVSNPLKYYRNNTAASRNLIEACVNNGVREFVFSSTAAVYGIPQKIPVFENSPTEPINPYGTSKLMTEWMLRDAAAAHDMNFVALRYFNVAGADPACRTGQGSSSVSHLIKIACQVVIGLRKHIEVYGDDYPTPDGTCIRDYIHVTDLAEAHVEAVRYLRAGGSSRFFNCGYGHGYSVREVLQTVEEIADCKLDIRIAPRRAGDPQELVAGVKEIEKILGWTPRYDDLKFIVRTAIDWEKNLHEEDTE